MTYVIEIKPSQLKIIPGSEIEEILQNVLMIVSTRKFSVPLDRAFGIDTKLIDEPIPSAQAKLTAEIAGALNQFEPRARLKRLSFSGEPASGILIPKIEVEIKE